jgi:hypothetical protein
MLDRYLFFYFYFFQTFISSYRITNVKGGTGFYTEKFGKEETVYFGMIVKKIKGGKKDMRKEMKSKLKLVFALVISTMFFVTTISSAGLLDLRSKTTTNTVSLSAEPEIQDNADVQDSSSANDINISNPSPPNPLGNDYDWNYWSNPPNMFPYVTGNIGIGTSTPNAKLEILNLGEDIIMGADSHNPSIELRDLDDDGHLPFIDFARTGTVDYDMRIMCTGDDALSIFGGNLGINVANSLAKLHVNEGAVLFSGTTGGTPTSGAGTRLMWIPAKAAFRAGIVVNDWWDDSNIGSNSVAMGFNPKASGSGSTALGVLAQASGLCSTAIGGGAPWAAGEQSIAMGSSTYASGLLSTAMGYFTMAGGKYSTAMGVQTGARGYASTAMGGGTIAFGNTSTAMGWYTNASGKYSTAIGNQTKAIGEYSTAMGLITKASGPASTAMGHYTTASGGGSTAIGYGTNASADYSTAMGYMTKASGKYSTAMGSNTKASAQFSTAMGYFTNSTGEASTATGYLTKASGVFSTAMGAATTASGDYSTAMGQTITVNGENSLGIGLDHNSPNWVVESNHVMSIMGGAVGIGTTNPVAGFQVQDGAVLFSGIYGVTPTSGAGRRLMWIPNKAAFRAGEVSGTQWNNANIGLNSIAMGYNTTAVGSFSTALGHGTKASGSRSTAIGEMSIASGYASTAIGTSTRAHGNYSTAMGIDMQVNGYQSVGIGLWDHSPKWLVTANHVMSIMGGNVGIGTTNPEVELDVHGDLTVREDIITHGNVDIHSENPGTSLDVKGDVEIKEGDVYISNLPELGSNVMIYGTCTAWFFIGGDYLFVHNGTKLWRMYEDENGLYAQSFITGKKYKFLLEEINTTQSDLMTAIKNLQDENQNLQAQNQLLTQRLDAIELKLGIQ